MIDEATDRDLLNELNHMTIEINIESLRENNNLEKFLLRTSQSITTFQYY